MSAPRPHLVRLTDPAATDPALTGGKASRLAELVQQGHAVPDGVVLTTEALRGLDGAADAGDRIAALVHGALELIDGPVAVRSSAVAEDLVGASFAGLYETVLDVEGSDAVRDAVTLCLAAAASERVRVYRERNRVADGGIALLVQRMVPATAAGVAFSADPVSGARDVVVVSAVPSVGEALVSGTADGEAWEVRGDEAVRRPGGPAVLSLAQVRAIATLARRLGADAPADIEWAWHDGLLLLQARPMTALPDVVSWAPPAPGGWVRNFRFGEWIGAPLSPLFASWLLPDLERAMHARFEYRFGMRYPQPAHVFVNGWYFYGLNVPAFGLRSLCTTLRHLWSHGREIAAVIPPIAHLGFDAELARWRTTLLPAWRAVVADAEARVEQVPPRDLPSLIEAIIAAAGLQAASILGVSGYAAKAEWALGKFWKRHLDAVDGTPFDVVVGAGHASAAHDVEGLDWMFPTAGERGDLAPPPAAEAIARVFARSRAVEDAARAALSPRLQRRFDGLLGEARRAHVARQEQTGVFTLGWPVMRQAVLRIGQDLTSRGVLGAAADVFFLRRAGLEAAVAGATGAPPVAARRATWERQRRLVPPLIVGELTGMFKDVFGEMEAFLAHADHDEPGTLKGMPGSPGRVSGIARVVRSIDDLHRLQPGEILVAPVTTPGWTPAFARAAGIVTDTGSVASHASIVAREHGVPAVVGTGDATARIADGQPITVDGGRGWVRIGAAQGPG